MKIAVFEKQGSDLSHQLRRALPGAELFPEGCRGCSFDMIVYQCGAPMADRLISADILICDSRCSPQDIGGFEASSVVTVGLMPRDTLTHSSTLQPGGMASLQREMISLTGEVIRPQEVELQGLEGDITEKLAVKAAQMLSGRPLRSAAE